MYLFLISYSSEINEHSSSENSTSAGRFLNRRRAWANNITWSTDRYSPSESPIYLRRPRKMQSSFSWKDMAASIVTSFIKRFFVILKLVSFNKGNTFILNTQILIIFFDKRIRIYIYFLSVINICRDIFLKTLKPFLYQWYIL